MINIVTVYRIRCDKRVGSAGRRAPRCNATKNITAESITIAIDKAEQSGWHIKQLSTDSFTTYCSACKPEPLQVWAKE